MPHGNRAAFMDSRSNRSCGWIEARNVAVPSMPGPRNSIAGPFVRLSTCRISVVERSGYSLLPNAKRSSAGRFSGSATSAKLASDESATTGALVWNLSQLATSAVGCIRASSQTGVSWSNRVSAIAAVPRIIAGGVPAADTIRWTLPGRAIAFITQRKVDCADNTLSANPAGNSATVVMSALTSHQCVEIDPCRGGLRGLSVSFFDHRRTQRRDHLGFNRGREFVRLHHGVAQRDQLRLVTVAAERVAEADFSGRKPHR